MLSCYLTVTVTWYVYHTGATAYIITRLRAYRTIIIIMLRAYRTGGSSSYTPAHCNSETSTIPYPSTPYIYIVGCFVWPILLYVTVAFFPHFKNIYILPNCGNDKNKRVIPIGFTRPPEDKKNKQKQFGYQPPPPPPPASTKRRPETARIYIRTYTLKGTTAVHGVSHSHMSEFRYIAHVRDNSKKKRRWLYTAATARSSLYFVHPFDKPLVYPTANKYRKKNTKKAAAALNST